MEDHRSIVSALRDESMPYAEILRMIEAGADVNERDAQGDGK